MYSYLVVKEADDGSWLCDPEMFDTLLEAKASVGDDPPREGEWIFYKCRELPGA
jgi:hypothetical protein